jgi:hypothetical protein
LAIVVCESTAGRIADCGDKEIPLNKRGFIFFVSGGNI